MHVFYLPNTNSVSLFFLKCHLSKNTFVHNHPKNTILLFYIFLSVFIIFSFVFPTEKQTKNAFFFPFWHPQNPVKQILSHPYTLFAILKKAQKHFKIAEATKQNCGSILTQLAGQFLTQEPPKCGPIFDTTAYRSLSLYLFLWLSLSLYFSL